MKKKRSTYNPLFSTTLLLLVAVNALAAEPAASGNGSKFTAPKLIIGIAVDQLRTDYLYALEERLSDNGLKLLLDKGIVYEQVLFDVDCPDATAALAALATGSYAFNNGVSAQKVYNPQRLREESVFFDKDYLGNFTSDSYSPRTLSSTTLADELKTASSEASRVYSIAPDAESAILAAGHTADCAFWIDDKQGKWASTTYYKGFPKYVEVKNRNKPLGFILSDAEWESMGKGGKLDIMPYHYETRGFIHTFYQYGQPVYEWFKSSPLVNDAIVELSEWLLTKGSLGKGLNTDMLQLTLYCGTWKHDRPELYAEELQDMYLRLDMSLKNLFSIIDQQIGLQNTLIYLTGTGQTQGKTTEIEDTKVGTFTGTRCTSLLNSFLVSMYGKGQYVVDLQDNQIYLNHREIEQKNLKLSEVQQAAAEFVMMFSGVEDVTTQYQILHNDVNERIKRMRRAYNRQTGGDLVLTLLPGWTFKYNDASQEEAQVRYNIAPGPAIIWSPQFKAERIATPVDATAIAPTIAACIRIRAPSAAKAAPLRVR
ncbi:MAG: alkaline phosphatase family protein [Bacteroidales bacterium]|nr:alkaline phosphatase family protein [Bacteroidales bacterium]